MSEVQFTEQEKFVINKVYELFRNQESWTTGSLAKNFQKESCDPVSLEACSWSLPGALDKFITNESEVDSKISYLNLCSSLFNKISKLIVELNSSKISLDDYNDRFGYYLVLELLESALSRS